jgi:hypothetical protein
MFGDPYIHNNWYIFPNTTLDNLILDDCGSSVTGKCENTSNVENCIKICEDNKDCSAGYFIETPDSKNICVPIKKIAGGPSLGPYYRLRNKNIYPQLNNVKSYVFAKKDYEFPPKHGNSIFYGDRFVLTNITANKSIGLTKEGKIQASGTLTTDPIFVQFLPKEVTRSLDQYLIVKNGDEVVLNIPQTGYVLKDVGGKVSWVLELNNSNNAFRIFTNAKGIGEILDYQDKIFLTSGNSSISYNQDFENLELSSESSENSLFKITPKIRVYYCDGTSCVSTELENTKMNGTEATYRGSLISRNPSCWGACRKGTNSIAVLAIILIITAILALIIFMRR